MTWGVFNLEVKIGRELVLTGIDLEIAPDSITVVVGGDGAGKTTLARVLGRLIPFQKGSASLPERRHVGYQSATSGSWSDLTVAENLRFVADSHRFTADDTRRRLDELLDATGLGSARDRLAMNLSGGMRQKLGVAMALMARPQVLVLDEPTTGVDPVSRSDLWQLISRAAAAGAAVVLTTTYLEEAERAAHILALESGAEIASGTPESIVQSLSGTIWRTIDRPADLPYCWRRGREWHSWSSDRNRTDARAVEPDLADVLTAMTLQRGSPA